MSYVAQIRAGLGARTGFGDAFLAIDAVKMAVRRRMEAAGAGSEEAYWLQLAKSGAEWSRLVDEIVVPETWFFRDEKPFEFLASCARELWPQRQGVFRALSAPCSTGEEPYSIAITLLEAGFSPGEFVIDAVDISERAIRTAENRLYSSRSFRGQQGVRERWFEPAPGGTRRLADAARSSVRFFRSSLLDPDLFKDRAPYDVIFCRNLLIYLDETARARLLAAVERQLSPNGLLFVGHAEPGVVPPARFRTAGRSGAFAFEKAAPKPAVAPAIRPPKPPAASPPLRPATSSSRKAPPATRASTDAPSAHLARTAASLAEATALADAGRLSAAMQSCQEYLAANHACPKGLGLMAVLALAGGDATTAEKLLNQVVYLAPDQSDAILRLAHLCEARGDTRAARRWRDRLARLGATIGK
jgi:chemotaxis protein methyltransferase WspC